MIEGMRALAARTKRKAAIDGAFAQLTDLERKRQTHVARTKKKHAKRTKDSETLVNARGQDHDAESARHAKVVDLFQEFEAKGVGWVTGLEPATS